MVSLKARPLWRSTHWRKARFGGLFLCLLFIGAPYAHSDSCIGDCGGSAGTDSVGTLQFDDAADTPVTGECVVVAANPAQVEYSSCAVGAGDNVFIAGVAAVNPDFRSEGDVSMVRCTGSGTPDVACPAAEDIIVRYNTASVDADALDEAAVEAGLEAVLDLPELQGVLIDGQIPAGIHRDSETKDGDLVDFDDENGDFDATNVDEAIEELVTDPGVGPNLANGKVHWDNLVGVPAGFADNTDDGAGGGSGDEVQIESVAATDPDFRGDGDIDFIRCTAAGVPDSACLAAEDVIARLDPTTLGTETWGAGATMVWTFDASAGTDCTITFGNGTVTFDNCDVLADAFITDDVDGQNVQEHFDNTTEIPAPATANHVNVGECGTTNGEICKRDDADGSEQEVLNEGNLADRITLGTHTVGNYAAGDAEAGAATSVATDGVGQIADIAAALKTGADAEVVTGTAGVAGNCGEWNADGDLVDAGVACGASSGSVNQSIGYWPAGSFSADGTECSDPAEVTLNSGPKTFTVACPMAGTETDGFLYGQTVVPIGFDKTQDVTFTLTAVLTTDAGAGTFHGAIDIQCQAPGELIDSTWGTAIGLDLAPIAGDVVNDVIQTTSAAVDTDTTGENCDAGDTLFWRWKACDTDATPSAGCTSSAGFEDDMSFLGMRLNGNLNL